jgi:hypothetical protein
MNTKLKITTAIISTSLLIFPTSAIIQNNNNIAKAENTTINSNVSEITNKNIEEGLIIKDYVKLQKKNNLYYYTFTNHPSLNERLKAINSNLTDKDIKTYINNLNSALQKENGNGNITNTIKEIRKYHKNNPNKINHYNTLRANRCSNTVFGLGVGTSAFYVWAGYLAGAGPAGLAVGITGAAVGAAIGAIGNWGC